ncbi:Smr/MutS family protein [Flavobacterium sp. SUN052]|uniref:Smr/MutS family protein n=1 Tax=Flavobacterium sp. SUN052 TaxID=3002441 RepID=UPI00237D5134|nr:Smr/MutS family protein [Flavobacterium sp. SUN052]MEC4003817.1 Smr/MutS family protein [Flavobacterium sp. SUN052]
MTTKKFEIGDKVSVLDDAIDGVVVSIKNDEITIETTDKFMMTFFVNELIKINNTNDLNSFSGSGTLFKKNIDSAPSKKQNAPTFKSDKLERGTPEFDLHIEKLVKNFKGMNNFDILSLQTETAKRHIEFAIRNRIPKIVFIHGVGEGVLKAELDFMLNRYEMISFQDANYQKYGLGATEVYFKQNVR